MWAAASALSGALVGILVPGTKTAAVNAAAKKAGDSAAQAAAAGQPPDAADAVREALATAARARTALHFREGAVNALEEVNKATLAVDEAEPHERAASRKAKTDAAAKAAVLKAGSDAAAQAQTVAEATIKADPWKAVILGGVLLLALGLGILMTLELGEHAGDKITVRDTAIKDLSGTLVALAAAAGGALVGLAAPSPSNTRSGG
jgi:thiol:disulfide interchange protein